MKKMLFIVMIAILNSCSATEFRIETIPNAVIYLGKDKFEYFDVMGSDGLSNEKMIEKLKQHTIQSLNVDSVKAYDYQLRIYYKHSFFSKYNTSTGSKWDGEGTRVGDSPNLFGAGDRRIGLVMINNSGAEFNFLSYIDTSIPGHEEIDSTFLKKLKTAKIVINNNL